MTCIVYQTVRTAPIAEAVVKQIVKTVFRRLSSPYSVVSVHWIGDTQMRSLNRTHRGMDRTTDVLAFAAHEGKRLRSETDDWGDIFLSVPKITRQARAFGVTTREECTRMLIHGLLHLAGYDHKKESEAKRMFRLQEQLLAACT